MKQRLAIGVDVGGSHISCQAYDLDKKQLLENTHAENDLNNHDQPDKIIKAWGDTIRESMKIAGAENIVGIGFAMPGPFDYVEGISLMTGENGKYENIYGLNVPNKLRKYLDLPKDFKIRFINDATAFAIGEDQVGMAKNYSHSLSVTLGTGFGSAFIKDGLPVVDGAEVPEQGCLWHLPLEGGIADDYFSTRGLIKRFQQSTGKQLPGVKEIAELAQVDISSRNLFEEFGRKMGIFLHPWIEQFGIEAFVIGGNISRAYMLFGDSFKDYLNENELKLEVFVSELKENASFIGAATLINDRFYEKVLPALKMM